MLCSTLLTVANRIYMLQSVHTCVQGGGPVADSVQSLADEVAAWLGVGDVMVKRGRALPASASKPTTAV